MSIDRRFVEMAGTAIAMTIVVFTVVLIGARPTPQKAPDAAVEQPIVSAPDISAMSPAERASRLYARVVRLHEQQKFDSLAFFTPMALAAYGAVTDIDDDGRYDMARIAMIAGAFPIARAQCDTILQRNSTHLLGLLLAADLARSNGDDAEAKRIEAAFVGAAQRERARGLPEYTAHAEDITSALREISHTVRK